jgi:hypothetical protein
MDELVNEERPVRPVVVVVQIVLDGLKKTLDEVPLILADHGFLFEQIVFELGEGLRTVLPEKKPELVQSHVVRETGFVLAFFLVERQHVKHVLEYFLELLVEFLKKLLFFVSEVVRRLAST